MTKLYDALIVGGGPAGLCAAINGASEGLRIAVLDSAANMGGQARESAAIENYPMPISVHNGVSGDDLTSGFVAMALKFRAELFPLTTTAQLVLDGNEKVVTTTDFVEFRAKTVILSTGLSYRRLEAEGMSRLMGRGVFYGVPSFIKSLAGKEVVLVGGANSAGQAAVRLARIARQVNLIVRSTISKDMSQYLIDKIQDTPNITVFEGATVQAVSGERSLSSVKVNVSGAPIKIDAAFMFIYIGAVPYTAWLMNSSVLLDAKRYVLTDADIPADRAGRVLLPNETLMPGVFAAGDVRKGQSVKRITGAVGDGISSLTSCHRYCDAWSAARG